MANNYTQWSESFEIKKESVEWLKELAHGFENEFPEKWDSMEADDLQSLLDYLKEKGVDTSGISHWMTYASDWPGFHFTIDGEDTDTPSLWVYSEEGGNIDHLCAFLQAYLKKFSPEEVFRFCWADSCSRLRVGEFGGGFAAISADEVISGNTYSLGEQAERDLLEKIQAKKESK